jgi:two-component system probable response regulator PhcQ
MDVPYDYKKFAILYVDDEEKSLKYFERAFGDVFRIFTAASVPEGYRLLEEQADDIGILMTDQRMPGEKGVQLLEKARQLRPRIIRILATAYADMDAAIAAVNTGAIYKYVTKPWDVPQLEATLRRGLEFFIVQRERDLLLREKLSVLHNMMIADRVMSLGLLAAGLSHHIRNSLVAVKTFLDLAPAKLQEEQVDIDRFRHPEFWQEYYQNVQAQVDKINSLLRDLWIASESPSFEFKDRLRLEEFMRDLLARHRAAFDARNLTVENLIPESLPELHVDRQKFRRLFELLFKDELVSLPAGSRIVLSARALDNGRSGDVTRVQIEVQDNGPGLPKDALRLLFDPFVPRSDSPAEYGINLMACYFIVHHHGGRIEAIARPEGGTIFRMTLPINPDQPTTAQDNTEFIHKVVLNDALWEKLLRSD